MDKKLLMKKKCKKCGNVVIVKIKKHGQTPSPESCASCNSLGKEKAIEQRLMSRRNYNKTIFKA